MSTQVCVLSIKLSLAFIEYDNALFLCPPLKKRGQIVLLMSVDWYVGQSVRTLVDQMVSDHYLKNYLSQGFHSPLLILISLG